MRFIALMLPPMYKGCVSITDPANMLWVLVRKALRMVEPRSSPMVASDEDRAPICCPRCCAICGEMVPSCTIPVMISVALGVNPDVALVPRWFSASF